MQIIRTRVLVVLIVILIAMSCMKSDRLSPAFAVKANSALSACKNLVPATWSSDEALDRDLQDSKNLIAAAEASAQSKSDHQALLMLAYYRSIQRQRAATVKAVAANPDLANGSGYRESQKELTDAASGCETDLSQVLDQPDPAAVFASSKCLHDAEQAKDTLLGD